MFLLTLNFGDDTVSTRWPTSREAIRALKVVQEFENCQVLYLLIDLNNNRRIYV